MYVVGLLTEEMGADRAEAMAALDESVALFRELGDDPGLAGALSNRARVGFADAARSGADVEESLALARGSGDAGAQFMGLLVTACWILAYGRPANAEGVIAEALAMARGTGSPQGLAHAIEGRLWFDLACGRAAEARAGLTELVPLVRAHGNVGCACHSVETAAWYAAIDPDQPPERAATLLGAATRLRATLHVPIAPYERAPGDNARAALLARGGVEPPPGTVTMDLAATLGFIDQMLDGAHAASRSNA